VKKQITISYAGRRKNRPYFSKSVFLASVKQLALEKKHPISSIQYVFMTDDELLYLNKEYLNFNNTNILIKNMDINIKQTMQF
jgi:hypothetical protein